MRVGVLLLVTVAAGLALLAAACGGGGEGATPTPTPVPAEGDAELTAEQAIQRVLEMLEMAPDEYRPDPATATATRMKDCETVDALRWQGRQWGKTPDYPSEKPVWLVKVRGEFSGFIGFGLTPPRAGTFVQVLGLDGALSWGAPGVDKRDHEGPALSAEDVIRRFMWEINPPPVSQDPDQIDVSAGTATAMTEREALETLEREGGSPDLAMRVLTDAPAWLVEIRGESVDSCTLAPLQGRYLSVRRADGSLVSSGFIPDPGATPGPAVELTQQQISDRAYELARSAINDQPGLTPAARRTTYGEALETLQREGASVDGAPELPDDLPVWLVEIRGEWMLTEGTPTTPRYAAGRYVFILNLRGGAEYQEQILDATLAP